MKDPLNNKTVQFSVQENKTEIMGAVNKEVYRIGIIEDSVFYNQLIHRGIEDHLNRCHVDHNRDYLVETFMSYDDFYRNFNGNTKLAFIDYQLDNNATGLWVVKEIRERCTNCQMYMLSDAKRIWDLYSCILEGADGIILKDKEAMFWCKYILENLLINHV